MSEIELSEPLREKIEKILSELEILKKDSINILKNNKWIPIKDQHPPEYKEVLLYHEDGDFKLMFVGHRLGEYFIKDHGHISTRFSQYSITHWMEAPSPPKHES